MCLRVFVKNLLRKAFIIDLKAIDFKYYYDLKSSHKPMKLFKNVLNLVFMNSSTTILRISKNCNSTQKS